MLLLAAAAAVHAQPWPVKPIRSSGIDKWAPVIKAAGIKVD